QPEKDEQTQIEGANKQSKKSEDLNTIASVLAIFGQFGFSGPSPSYSFGGLNLNSSFSAASAIHSAKASKLTRAANMSARNAAEMRRRIDWSFERDRAENELKRLDKDKLAAEIRLAMAKQELSNIDRQIEESEETARFLTSKFTNSELYGWMSGQLSQLHYQSFTLALDLARQAEACMRFELDEDTSETFVGAGHWSSARKGLVAGQALGLDLRRMEAHYLANNSRKSEISKTVSLVRLAPEKLLELRRTGNCEFELPGVIFDLDHPGQLRRRIKSVSLTIPAVAGPHTSIGARLELQDSYIETPGSDGEIELVQQSIRNGISTSSAQDDAGLFQLDFRDERYLPFEGAGVISKWKLALPAREIAQFNYNTIADVIMHIRYTSEYDSSHRDTVEDTLSGAIAAFDEIATEEPVVFQQLLSLRYDFPSEWARLAAGEVDSVSVALASEHFGYLLGNRGPKISKIELRKKPLRGANDSAAPDLEAQFDRSGLGELDVPVPNGFGPVVTSDIADYDVIVSFAL
ncbi:MAG: hypothetical protein AAGE86_11400, partial [Pseudomonadota bacterium]